LKFTLFPLLFASFLLSQPSVAQENTIRLNSPYTYRMLDHTTEVNRKHEVLLDARSNGSIGEKELVIGLNMNVIADAQSTNRDAKFGYLMRHPTQNNQGGKSSSEVIVHDVNLQLTATPLPWATAYAEILYNPEQSFGRGTITDLNRNQLQMRKAYALIGDLNEYPVYGAFGKMTTPFGLTDTVSPFTSSTLWHSFGGLVYGGLLGYDKGGLNLSAMAIQGGPQFRAANSGDDLPDEIANYTINGSYTHTFDQDRTVRVGGGYLDGSAYCQPWPVTHFSSCEGFTNPAWGAHLLANWDRFTLLADFAETTEDWPGTQNPTPPLDVFEPVGVSSQTLGAKYDLPLAALGGRDLGISLEYSDFEAGAEGSPWERQEQLVFGLEMNWNQNAKIFGEYIKTNGYVPLNFLSGPDPFDETENPATTHSDADAESDVFVIGLLLAL